MTELLFACWFFLPAGLANGVPVPINKISLFAPFDVPLDGGKQFRGKPIFGANKRWRGLIGGTITGILAGLLQIWLVITFPSLKEITGPLDYASGVPLVLGGLLGFGALMGDAIESFFKRQLGVKPGHAWFPFDQIDYILGGLLMSLLVVQLPWAIYAYILVLWFGVHVLFSYLGYLAGLKDRPI